MQKQGKKALQKQSYSHPLIKSLAEAVEEDQEKVVPTYQPIIPSHQNRTSSKILRYSTRTPSKNSTFTAFATPLHPITEDLPVLQPVQCQVCGCRVNPHSQIQNYSQLLCNLCGATSQIATYSSQQHKNTFAYRYSANVAVSSQRRRVCFVLQASQHSFEKKMHRGVVNALVSLNGEDFDACFVLFDAKYLYLVDQSCSSLCKISLSEEEQPDQWDCLPLGQQQMFASVSQFNEQIAQVIESVMYEAYYTQQTVLPQVTRMLSRCLKHCEIKFFITTLNQLSQQQHNTEAATFLDKIFRDKQNQPQSKAKKTSTPNNPHKVSRLFLDENMQFFILAQHTTYQQAISLLNYNIVKIYDPIGKYKLQESLYYDLFQNLQTQWAANLVLSVRTSNCLQVMQPEYPSFDLYGRVKMAELPNDGRHKHYQFTIKQCSHNTMLPIRFKLQDATACDKLFFQITYNSIVLNGQFLKVYPQSQMGLEFMDDESLFNEHLRNSLVGWNGQSFKELRQRLQDQYQSLIRLFKSNYRYDSINFPKTMKHYFLYIFSLLHKLKLNVVNSHSIYKMINFDLETYSKQLYLRAYRHEGDQLRNIKSNKAVFDNYPLIFMENGEELFMIFSDAPVSEVKDIFGRFDTIASLANSNYELPDLPTNTKYRKAISLIRQSNGCRFLRLKIVDLESSFFQCYIQPMLYDKAEHFDFLRKAWKNA